MNTLIILVANYTIYVLALIAAIYWLRSNRSQKIHLAVIGAISAAISLLLIELAGAAYYDPRPFVVHHTVPLLKHAADNGFPSDHTVLATVVALVVFQASRKLGLSMLVLAVLLGVSRVTAQVHSPLDIAAALVIGALAVALAVPLANLLLKKHNELAKELV